ncbi:cytochrome P450 [Sciscionella sediminilitoris]|uniref:cytochrome P450 n=1 Tax=Sciscionella sediminilitoris TaxID=1445613 RepID=UPI0004DF3632|nr:cytochrome P450 [Sciscionella sp. SE31]
MTELAEDVTLSFPRTRSCPFAPPAEYRQLREETPISKVSLPDGRRVWALSRHEDIRAMLTDPRFSSDRKNPKFPRMVPGQQFERIPASMISMDAPEHGPARRKVVGEFTVKRMRALRPRIQSIVDEHVEAMLAGPRPVDLVQALSLPVPSLVICEQLGVPYADHEFFQQRSTKFISWRTPADERRAAIAELGEYLEDLVRAKQRDPGDDLLGRQITEHAPSHAELVGLAFILLVAGHETTANMISLSTVLLLNRPGDLEAIKADPGKTPAAVEELLRYFTIAELANSRFAVEDVELGGVLIRAGDGVLALSNAANRDPAAFAEPDEFDIERGARHHVAFGYGPHQCLGQNLARMELQIVIDTLFARIPGLRLTQEIDEIAFKDQATIYGIKELPVTW